MKKTMAACLAVAAMGTGILPALADPPAAPADTASFVAYCTEDANFEACRLRVVDRNNMSLIDQSFNHVRACTFPIPVPPTPNATHDASILATHAVISWLANNAATRMPATDDAIAQAFEALWPENCGN